MNRFDIIIGHFLYYVHNYESFGDWMYRRQCRIRKYFSPSPLLSLSSLREDDYEGVREVYNELAHRYGGEPIDDNE